MKLQPLERAPDPAWPDILEARRQQCLRSLAGSDGASPAYTPFTMGEYPFKFGSLWAPPWSSVIAEKADALVPCNPAQPSAHRPRGLAVWDAAVAIPQTAFRPKEVIDARRPSVLRNTNTAWPRLLTDLHHVGPLGAGGSFVRPAGDYIVDLMLSPNGWALLEAAHVLTHLRGEHLITRKAKDAGMAPTSELLKQCVAELVVSLIYGLPIDTSVRTTSEPVDVPHYGLRVCTVDTPRLPMLAVPWLTRRAPVLDSTLGFIATGIFIEPVPAGVLNQSLTWLECNRWACLPTLVVISGWELIDLVSHGPLGSTARTPEVTGLRYCLHPADLMTPASIPSVLQAIEAVRGVPRVNNVTSWYVQDWMASVAYTEAKMCTPPLPCPACMCYNRRTQDAPKQPGGLWRTKLDKKEAEEKAAWLKAKSDILNIAGTATVFYEKSVQNKGITKVFTERRQRKAAYAGIRATTERIRVLDKKMKRAYKNGMLSEYRRLKTEADGLKARLQATTKQGDIA